MPHIIIEYSADVAGQIDINELIVATHAAALSSELFPEYDIKTRAIAYEQHRTGQTRDSFVHISVHLLSGRSDEQKVMLSEKVLEQLSHCCHKLSVSALKSVISTARVIANGC